MPLIDSPSTLDQHLAWYLIDILVESQLIFANMPSSINGYIWVGWHSADYRLTVKCRFLSLPSLREYTGIEIVIECWPCVGRVSIEMLIKCRLTADAFCTHDPAIKDLNYTCISLKNILPGNSYFQEKLLLFFYFLFFCSRLSMHMLFIGTGHVSNRILYL